MCSFGDVAIAEVIATMRPHSTRPHPREHGSHEGDRHAVVKVERNLEVFIRDLGQRTRLRAPVV